MEYAAIKRDEQLDIYRAMSMMYVLCVTHVVYWLYIGLEPIKSLILVEMPIIFFITGASLSLTKKKSFRKALKNRTKRVLIPYYIYSLVILICILLLSIFWHFFLRQITSIIGAEKAYNHAYDITAYKWEDILNIIGIVDISQAHFVYHLWFILPYLILTCTFGYQINLIQKMNRWVYVLLCIVLFSISQAFEIHHFFTTLLGYNIFIVVGYLFYRRIKTWQVIVVCFFAIVTLIAYILPTGDFCPMQNHKFPPDWLFVTYNIIILCLLSLMLERLTFPSTKVFRLWNTRGYTIYLYQSVVFTLVDPFYKLFVSKIDLLIIHWAICALLVWSLSTILSYITYPFEQYMMSKMKSIIQ